uniref:Uncharacterized protein n=1 Tax=Oryza glumipatula TaxID=40148 RepID=A0A0E0AG34_9ORYZ
MVQMCSPSVFFCWPTSPTLHTIKPNPHSLAQFPPHLPTLHPHHHSRSPPESERSLLPAPPETATAAPAPHLPDPA